MPCQVLSDALRRFASEISHCARRHIERVVGSADAKGREHVGQERRQPGCNSAGDDSLHSNWHIYYWPAGNFADDLRQLALSDATGPVMSSVARPVS